jgi:hypothetical protein
MQVDVAFGRCATTRGIAYRSGPGVKQEGSTALRTRHTRYTLGRAKLAQYKHYAVFRPTDINRVDNSRVGNLAVPQCSNLHN